MSDFQTYCWQYGLIRNWVGRRITAGADLVGGGGGGGVRTPLSYMKNDVMHTVIYAVFCMLPSLDLQACSSQAGSISI